MVIVNLTQHAATDDQRVVGVVDMADRTLVCDLLNFEEIPTNAQPCRNAGVILKACKRREWKRAQDMKVSSRRKYENID